MGETFAKCDGNFVRWFNNSNPLISVDQLRVVKRSSATPLGEPIIVQLDMEKEALETIFDDAKEGRTRRKRSTKRASRQRDDVFFKL